MLLLPCCTFITTIAFLCTPREKNMSPEERAGHDSVPFWARRVLEVVNNEAFRGEVHVPDEREAPLHLYAWAALGLDDGVALISAKVRPCAPGQVH
jgi:hypothetical protein